MLLFNPYDSTITYFPLISQTRTLRLPQHTELMSSDGESQHRATEPIILQTPVLRSPSTSHSLDPLNGAFSVFVFIHFMCVLT